MSRGPAAPGLSEVDVRAEVVKLLPAVAIKSAPPGGYALTQFESIFWADTPTVRDLGSAALLGHQIAITVTAQSTAWSFGDGARATSSGPGRPYVATDPCRQVQCPGWFGHTYTQTGAVTVTAAVGWTATYTVDAGPTQTITGTVTGPVATLPLAVKQARAVLVPDPTH